MAFCDTLFGNVVALIHFNGSDGAQSATDVSTYGRTVTFGNSAEIDTAQSQFGGSSCLFTQAGAANPSESFVSMADAAELQLGANSLYTVEAWVLKAANNDRQVIASKYNNSGNNREWFLSAQSGNLLLNLVANGSTVVLSMTQAHSLGDAAFHHVAFERNGDSISLYQDGTMIRSISFTSSVFNGTEALYVGKFRSTGFDDLPWNGHIDEFRMTIGSTRYDGDYTLPTSEFPSSLCVGGGPGGGTPATGDFTRAFPTYNRIPVYAGLNRDFPSP